MGKRRVVQLGMLFAILFSIILFLYPRFAQTMEWETDRPGMDYKSFDLTQSDPRLCESACNSDPNCRAWTYVQEGVQGPKARCWLKSGIPPAVKDQWCRSGIYADPPGVKGIPNTYPCSNFSFVSPSPLPSTGVGYDYKYQIQVSGGAPPLHFLTRIYSPDTGRQIGLSCLEEGFDNLPSNVFAEPRKHPLYARKMLVPGLFLRCDGIIFGQPTAAGYYSITIVVNDNCPWKTMTIEKNFVLEVKGPSPK